MDTSYVGKTCPYCQTPLKPHDMVVICAACDIPHHAECWQENHGCTTFGCSQGRDVAAGDAAAAGPPTELLQTPGNYLRCPECGYLMDPFTLACPRCARERQAPVENGPIVLNNVLRNLYITFALVLLFFFFFFCIHLANNTTVVPYQPFVSPPTASSSPSPPPPSVQVPVITPSPPAFSPSPPDNDVPPRIPEITVQPNNAVPSYSITPDPPPASPPVLAPPRLPRSPDRTQNTDLHVMRISVEYDYGLRYLVGTVENTGPRERRAVMVEFDLFDDSGASVGYATDIIISIPPGGSQNFRALIYSDQATQYRLRSITSLE